jgi:hypothetical protein
LHRLGRKGGPCAAMQQKDGFPHSGRKRICHGRRISASFMRRKALSLFPLTHIESRRSP